jgi:hypothetical protein
MTEQPPSLLVEQATAASDSLVAFEDRLLRGARLRHGDGADERAKIRFHVHVEDLLAEPGRRGAPRRSPGLP